MLLILSCLVAGGTGSERLPGVARADTIGRSAMPGWRWSSRRTCATQRTEVSAFTRAARPKRPVLIGIAARLFGFDPQRRTAIRCAGGSWCGITLAVAGARNRWPTTSSGALAWLAHARSSGSCLSRAFFGWFDRRQRERLLAAVSRRAGNDRALGPRRHSGAGSDPHRGARGAAPDRPEFSRLVSQISVGVADG